MWKCTIVPNLALLQIIDNMLFFSSCHHFQKQKNSHILKQKIINFESTTGKDFNTSGKCLRFMDAVDLGGFWGFLL